jgi:hypothetical protein
VTSKSVILAGAAATLLVGLGGCAGKPQARGESNAIIVVAVDSLWQQVEDSVRAALEPTILTVRDERTFDLTPVSPLSQDWVTLRQFRQVLVLGQTGDGWVAPVLGAQESRTPPFVADATDVWARHQLVTAVVLPADAPAAAVRAALAPLALRLDSLYRVYAQRRMYTSQPDLALRDSLAARAGFSLLLPQVYRTVQADSIYGFVNRTESGDDLRRTITVASRPGVDSTLTAEAILAWREQLHADSPVPQTAQATPLALHARRQGAVRAVELQGIWNGTDPQVPMAGPFLTRIVPCAGAGRTFLVDAWLYAPAKKKYEYMIQLETLLDTFRCGGDAVAPSPVV